MKRYETVFILDPGLDDSARDKEIKKIEEFIESKKGKVIQSESWGLRRLSYRIKKKTEGYYVFILFEAPTTLIRELDRYYKLNENLLRYLIVQQKEKRKLSEEGKKPSDTEGRETKVQA